MAIDTRAKRQSAAWVGFPGPVSVLPAGAIDQPARHQIGWAYRGILAGIPAAVVHRLRMCMGLGQ
jgi:hypothetical protein